MQHHAHITRPAQHMRSAHTNNIQIHPAPVLPLPQQQPPTQLQQKLPQTSNIVPQTTNMRDQQNRSNKPHLPSGVHNQTTQMQKIRQQHQHLNYKNNNSHHHSNNNTNNNGYQQYNHTNVPQQQQQEQQPHMGVLQQQHQQQQPVQHQTVHRSMPPMHHQQKQQHQHHNVLQMKNHIGHHQQQQQQHQLQQINNPNIPKPQQIQTYAYVGNKVKYNNNNNNNNSNSSNSSINNNNTAPVPATTSTANYPTPKTILQNPNRLTTKQSNQLNSKSTSTTTTLTVVTPAAKDSVSTDVENLERNIANSNVSVVSNESPSPKHATTSVDINDAHVEEHTVNTTEGEEHINEGNKENISSETQVMTSSGGDNGNQQENDLLSNVDSAVTKHTKEKTPMCLVNELARFNKITHQYRLTGEKGPAHCKRFTVTLKLGDEEYTAEGFKIKKAQHLAAAQAIEKTAYKHPIPKANRNNEDGRSRPYIMPTVELNALAMKLGQQTYYLFDPRQMPPSMPSAPPTELIDVMHDGGVIPTHHHYGGPRPPMPPATSAHGHGGHIMPPPPPLPPSHQRIIPEPPYGPRRSYDIHGGIYTPPPPPPPPPHIQHINQRAYLPHRGYAPIHRYHQRYPILPPPPPPGMPSTSHHMHSHFGVPTTPYKITLIVGKQKFIGIGRTLQQAKHDAAARALQVLKSKAEDKLDEELDESIDENDSKSPISQVHEAAVKRNMQVHFKILREEGPAHMRNFITACIVGSVVTEGEGHGKKISKKRAAEKMLLELKKLPPLTPVKSPSKRIKVKTPAKITTSPNGKIGTTSGTLVKRGKRESQSLTVKSKDKDKDKEKERDEEDDENPITKLIQIQQNRKEKEPIFEFLTKNGNEKLRRREFTVEVTAQGMVARGTGKNKKLAKRNAAANLLNALAEAAKNSTIDSGIEEANESITNTSSASSVPTTADKSKDGKEQKSINSPKEKSRTAQNIVNVADIPIVSTTAGQVPGILILRQNKKSVAKKKESPATEPAITTVESEPTQKDAQNTINILNADEEEPVANQENTSAMAAVTTHHEPIEEESSCSLSNAADTPSTTVEATVQTTTNNTSVASKDNCNNNNNNGRTNTNTSTNTSATVSSALPMMKHQLLYLAKLLGFEVDFSDYPKGNHNEFLTIVTLSTDPPQICHGFGKNTNESQNDAARNALKILSDLGLNNAKSN